MFKKKDSSPNIWMSFADLITGSLVVFILITIVLVMRTKDQLNKLGLTENTLEDLNSQLDSLMENNVMLKDSLITVVNNFETLNKEMLLVKEEAMLVSNEQDSTAFQLQQSLYGIEGIQISSKGVIRFYSDGLKNNNVLFKNGQYKPEPYLKDLLRIAWPQFSAEIKKVKFKEGIIVREIRIEGHTNSRPFNGDIHGNLGLSQKRAAETWLYINNNLLKGEDVDFVKLVNEKVVTVGFGEQKLINNDGELLIERGGLEDFIKSRRIELSVIYEASQKDTTNSELETKKKLSLLDS